MAQRSGKRTSGGAENAAAGQASAPRKRGPPPRGIKYTRALYRFREDQLAALRAAALERARRQGVAAVDISAILRALVDEWIKGGAKLPKEEVKP